jgi:hypothetical protein
MEVVDAAWLRNEARVGGSGVTRRASRTMLYADYPILRKISPVIQTMRKWDCLAFAAELLILGYSIREVAKAASSTKNTVTKLRDRMKLLGMIPKNCVCGENLGHRGWCRWRLERSTRRRAFLQTKWKKLLKETFQ